MQWNGGAVRARWRTAASRSLRLMAPREQQNRCRAPELQLQGLIDVRRREYAANSAATGKHCL